MTRRQYEGGAVPTTIGGSIGASGGGTVTIASATGWPDGTVGPFLVVVNRGESNEEKILVSERSGTTLTYQGANRGYDGSTAGSHSSGETIEHIAGAIDFDEANDHINDTTRDDHTQYLDTDRHDVTGRHAFGAALGTPAAPADIGTAASAGSGDNPAREDHVHQLGAGSIDSASMFAAGVVDTAALGDGQVTYGKLAALPTGRWTRASSTTLTTGGETAITWTAETEDDLTLLSPSGAALQLPATPALWAAVVTLTLGSTLTDGFLIADLSGSSYVYHKVGRSGRYTMLFPSLASETVTFRVLHTNGSDVTLTSAALTLVRLGAL